jgi:hypothetical protein
MRGRSEPPCPDANADIAIFELCDGNFQLRDSDGNTVTAKRRLIAQMTIKDGGACGTSDLCGILLHGFFCRPNSRRIMAWLPSETSRASGLHAMR